MECAWISNFVILETEALLTFCQEEHGVGSERARAGAGLKAGFLRQKNIRTKEVCADKNILFFCPVCCGVRVERAAGGITGKPRPIGGKGGKDGAVPEP